MINYESNFGYVPNITFTLEQHLKNYSEIEVNARRLLETFHFIRDKMEVNLRPVIALFPHYSEHSHEHSEHIISAIEKILGRKRIEMLSPADTWMLLVCAYMHDLGMLVQGKELASDWKSLEFENHIKNCMTSHDDELKKAAINVTSIEWKQNTLNWPVQVYRDVILLASEFYRRKHPERARTLPQREELKQALNSFMNSDGKIPQRIQGVVGKICFSHGIPFVEMLELLEPMDSLLGYEFHPRLIAALLCIGDLCDLDNGRFNPVAIEVFGGLTKSNLVHYYKHESVTSFVVQKDMISVIFNIQNRKIKNVLKNNPLFEKTTDKELQDFCDMVLLETQNWIGWLEDIVKNIKLYWNEFHISDLEALKPSLSYKILVEGKETISSKKNMRFSFSNEKAYELIESYSLYNNKLAFVRELLQNSIDALKRQFWIDMLSGRWNHLLKHLEKDGKIDYKQVQPYDFSDSQVFDYYKVRIRVNHNDDDQFANFLIEDNGTGISKHDVENRIIKTGIHNDSCDDMIHEMPEWLKPTSAFGIGLHSVFSVADTLFVQTKTELDNMVYNINMHSGKVDGYIFMSVAEQQEFRFCNCNHGTRMEFSVNVSRCTQNIGETESYDDPLNERPESNFCRILQNMLNSIMEVSMFHTTYQFNCGNEISLPRLYQDGYIGLLFKQRRRSNVFGESLGNKDYDFALDIGGEHIIIWDRKRAISMVYCLKHTSQTEFSAFCKGFKVENAKILNDGYNMIPEKVDYWGGNTKNILNVSRDSLSPEQIESNKEIFSQARIYMAEVYYWVLNALVKDSDIKEWHKDISEFMKPWLAEKKVDIEKPILTRRLISFFDKYNTGLNSREQLKDLMIRHGFCLLLKQCREHIQNALKSLDDKKQIQYVLNFELVNEDNSINSILKKHTYLYEFMNESLDAYDDEDDKEYIRELFASIFRSEYADIFINCQEHELYNITRTYHSSRYGGVFGEAYISLLVSFWSHAFKKIRARFLEYSNKEDEDYEPRPLDIYLSVPITRMLYLLICTGKEISSIKEELESLLSYIPGYDNHYGFVDANSFIDLIMSSHLSIENKRFNENLVEYLPFMQWLPCKSISVNSDGELILHFSNVYEQRGLIDFQGDAFSRLLHSHSHIRRIPVPVGYEDIAINQTATSSMTTTNYVEELYFYENYVTCLWDEFSNITEEYGQRLKDGESKETIIDEIMPSSRTDDKPTINLLRYIYHNRVYNTKLPLEEVWEKILETYTRFVSMVLDCIE